MNPIEHDTRELPADEPARPLRARRRAFFRAWMEAVASERAAASPSGVTGAGQPDGPRAA
jgi:hypothetical protein